MDAECTHDGSIKHIQKFENWGWTTLERRVLDADRTDDLTVLQVELIIIFNQSTVELDHGSKQYLDETCQFTIMGQSGFWVDKQTLFIHFCLNYGE